MGKKGKKSTRPDKNIQELQSGISAMSLQEAMFAIKAATASIDRMKQEQKDAARAVQMAKEEISKSSIASDKKQDHYSDKDFWDQRYASEDSGVTESTYEWYVSYNSIRDRLLNDLRRCESRVAGRLPPYEILVAGCGNSVLCEDLWREGFRDICGMDYSANVISTMQSRQQLYSMTSVRYLQADGCNIPTTMHRTCRAVLDKGTLDAIASGDTGSDANGGRIEQYSAEASEAAAVTYLRNMWALLVVEGIFVIITTMPPSIFNLLAQHIVEIPRATSYSTSLRSSGGFKQYEVSPLKTDAGGDVFYYVLTKYTEAAPLPTPVNTIASGSAGSKTDENRLHHSVQTTSPTAGPTTISSRSAGSGILSDDMQRVLQETQEAIRQLAEARTKVDERMLQRTALKTDIEEAEQRVHNLSHTLDSSWKDVSAGLATQSLDEIVQSDSSMPMNSTRVSEPAVGLTGPLPQLELSLVPKKSPQVNLRVVYEASQLQTDGYIAVEYELTDGEWDEDDYIAVEEITTLSATTTVDTAETAEDKRSALTYFEYTEEPHRRTAPAVTGSGNPTGDELLVGQVKISCPPYGGLFQVFYYRTKVEIATGPAAPVAVVSPMYDSGEFEEIMEHTANVVAGHSKGRNDSCVLRSTITLSRSEVISIPFPLQHLGKLNSGPSTMSSYKDHTGTTAGPSTALRSTPATSGRSGEFRVRCRGNNGRGGVESIAVDSQSPLGVTYSVPERYDTMRYMVEDMRNISTLAVYIGGAAPSSPAASSQCYYSKVSAWVTMPISPADTTGTTICITVEADTCLVPSPRLDSSVATASPQLSYSVLPLPVCSGWSLHLDQAYGVVTSDASTGASAACVTGGNRILIKIPYSLDKEGVVRSEPELERMMEIYGNTPRHARSSRQTSGGLVCSLCSSLVLPGPSVRSVEALPSGMFDHIMHEFVCSESTPTMPLSVSDMATPNGCIYLSDVFLTVNPIDTCPKALVFACKRHPSLLDAVAGTGHIVEHVQRGEDIQQAAMATAASGLAMVDTSTCEVSCRRCFSVLGDAQMMPDSTDHSEAILREDKPLGNSACHDSSENEQTSPSAVGQFDVTDLQDIKFLRDRVQWQTGIDSSSPVIVGSPLLVDNLKYPCDPEVVITNALLAMVNRFEVSTFELFVPSRRNEIRRRIRLRILTRVVPTLASTGAATGSEGHPGGGYGVHWPSTPLLPIKTNRGHCSRTTYTNSDAHDDIECSASVLPLWYCKEAVKVSYGIVNVDCDSARGTGGHTRTGGRNCGSCSPKAPTAKGSVSGRGGRSVNAAKPVPVELHVLSQLEAALASRQQLCGSSFFPGESMSFLYR